MDTPPNDETPAPDQPVAYDQQGRPLYAAPQRQVVHVSRAVEPEKPVTPPEIAAKHAASLRQFPNLNLSESEYVLSAVRRHPIGLIIPVGISIFLVSVIASIMINFPLVAEALNIYDVPYDSVLFVGTLLLILFGIGGYIVTWVYLNNKFFLTNESVIQEIQVSLFSKHEQTVSLSNIEDASFRQKGIIQSLFDYGSIRLSTEGDETTYRFNYVAHPKRQIALLNNAVEAFKMGRPVVND